MTSYSGSVAYLKYVALSNKGDVHQGDEFNSVFGLGKMTEARRDYTAQVIVESLAAGEHVGLTPIECGKFVDPSNDQKYDAKIIVKNDSTGETTTLYKDAAYAKNFAPASGYTAKVYYFSEEFQMEHVPAQDIPTIGPKLEHIALVAEPRRIAVRYDQITAFQA